MYELIDSKRDLWQELLKDTLIISKCKNNTYAQNLYAALCNMQWQPTNAFNILRNDLWSASWRRAGEIVASIRNITHLERSDKTLETYSSWYCSSLIFNPPEGAVQEGVVTEEINRDLNNLGWHKVPYDDLPTKSSLRWIYTL